MAKRFTDTEKWKKEWYRKLGSENRDIWNFLLDHCDHAGIWEIDCGTISYFIGKPISVDSILNAFGERIILLDDQKLFITGFIEFQYGRLNPDSRIHKSVISILEKRGIDPITLTLSKGFPKTSQSLKDKDKEQDQEKDQEQDQAKEKAVEDFHSEISSIAHADQIDSEALRICSEDWHHTLSKFRCDRPLKPNELELLARSIAMWGARPVQFAIIGARFEGSSGTYDPSKNVSLSRVLPIHLSVKDGREQKFDRLMNMGVQACRDGKATASLQKIKQIEEIA